MAIWKSIPSLGGHFEASNEGHLRRIHSEFSEKRKRNYGKLGRIHPGSIDSRGYLGCVLVIGHEKKRVRLHQIVSEAFLGPCPSGMEVNHKNGIKTDNRIENLEYLTRSENMKHFFRLNRGRS